MKVFYLSILPSLKTLALVSNGVKFTNIHYAGNINFSDQLFTCPLPMESFIITGLSACLLAYLLARYSTKLKLATADLCHPPHIRLTLRQKQIDKDIRASQMTSSKLVSDSIQKDKKHEGLPSAGGFSILLVMSDKIISNEWKNSLFQNFQVTLVEDSKEIKSSFLRQRPDAIIIDESVNGVYGDELCARLKADKGIKSIPIVLLVRTTDNESYSSHEKSEADLLELYTTDICKFKTDMRMLIKSHRKWHQPAKNPSHNNSITITIPLPKIIQKGDESQEFINRLNEKLEKNGFTEGYAVENLASDMNACRSCLYKKVRAITGKSPKYYMTTFKMETAVRLLVTTDISLKNLATALGICDEKQLIKSFKKYHGISPTEYKKLHSK